METEVLPEMTIAIPGIFDTLTDQAGNKVNELGLGTVWNEWNTNWSGVDIAGSEVTRINWPRGSNTTSVSQSERVDRTRTGVRSTLVPGGLQTQSMGNRVVQIAFATFMRTRDITFTADMMKPSTRVFPFFDGVDISEYVTPTGSTAGAALTTNAAGQADGVFTIPDPKVSGNPKWRVGKRAFRLTTSSTNDLTEGLVFSSAETDYTQRE